MPRGVDHPLGFAATTMADLGVPNSGNFFLYLCSGPSRPDGVDVHLRALCASPLINIDLKIGGYDHDLADKHVARAILQAASSSRCRGILVSIPCTTWSVARSIDAGGGSLPFQSRCATLSTNWATSVPMVLYLRRSKQRIEWQSTR